jgi:hypothetical protein
MTGPEHYAAAERLLSAITWEDGSISVGDDAAAAYTAAAQVHATLALAAATARANAANMPALDANQWNQVA